MARDTIPYYIAMIGVVAVSVFVALAICRLLYGFYRWLRPGRQKYRMSDVPGLMTAPAAPNPTPPVPPGSAP